MQDDDSIPTLTYSPPVPHRADQLLNGALAFSALVSFGAALNDGLVYTSNVGSRCGTPQASAETLVWITALPGLLFCLAALMAAILANRFHGIRLPLRLILICTAFQGLCMLSPMIWQWRSDWW